MHGRQLQRQDALAQPVAARVGKRFQAKQHGGHVIAVAGLPVGDAGDQVGSNGHQTPPALEYRPQRGTCPQHNNHRERNEDRGPTPLYAPDIALGSFALDHQPFTLGQPVALLLRRRLGPGLAGSQEGAKQWRDLWGVLSPARDPDLGVGKLRAAQQQVVGRRAADAPRLPPRGKFAEARVLANPIHILSQRGREFAQGPREGLALTEENVVEAPQLLRHLGVRHRYALDRDQSLA